MAEQKARGVKLPVWAGEPEPLDAKVAGGLVIDMPPTREEAEDFGPDQREGPHEPDPDVIAIAKADDARRPGRRSYTIGQAVERYLAARRATIGIEEGLKPLSYQQGRQNLSLALAGLDAAAPLSSLDHDGLTTFRNTWMARVATAANPEGLSKTTVVNYLKAAAAFMRWASADPGIDYRIPDAFPTIFKFKKRTATNVRTYDPAALKLFLDHATPRAKLLLLLTLNTGGTQADVGTLTHAHILREAGETFIFRKRRKEEDSQEYETLHWLWPETAALLDQHLAPAGNAHGRAILNDEGKPLYQVIASGEGADYRVRKIDNIDSVFDRLERKLRKAGKLTGSATRWKDLRKTGVTWMEHKFADNGHRARLFAAQAMPGQLRHYVRADFGPLTEALRAWRDELKAAGVF